MIEPSVPGLASSLGVAVPLQAVSLEGEVLAGHCILRVTQTYRNSESEPIEALYTFPLPSDGAVTAFRYSCGGAHLEGQIRNRDEGLREYTNAVHSGHGAALLELERDDVFSVSVGNVPPGEDVSIEVEVMSRLDFVDGLLRLKIPTLVAPRYIPGAARVDRSAFGWAEPTDVVPDADRITPPVGEPSYTATLRLVVALGFQSDISSPSHELRLSSDPDNRQIVEFAFGDVQLDRDLVLRFSAPGREVRPGLVANRTGSNAGGTFALTLLPDLGGATAGRRSLDVAFVLDRSGSMGGESMREAKSALRACLRQLRTGDRFALLAFDTVIEEFSSGLCPFDEPSLEAAERWIAGIEARGGTELASALERALHLVPDGTVVLLTDAQVGDESRVRSRLLSSRASARVFSFGIGTNIASGLLASLAKHSGGAVEEIHPREAIAEKIVAQFARAVAVRVEGVTFSVEGVDVDHWVPAPPVALTDGEPFVLLGRYQQPGCGTLVMSGTLAGRPWSLESRFELPSMEVTPALERVWAKRRIAELERISLAAENPRRRHIVEEEALSISLEFGVLCRASAFVVVERRSGDRQSPGSPSTRVVPVLAPAGWDMMKSSDVAYDMDMPMDGLSPRPLALRYCVAELPECRPGFQRRRGLEASHTLESGHDGSLLEKLFSEVEEVPRSAAGEPLNEGVGEPNGNLDYYRRRIAGHLWDDLGDGLSGAERRVRATARALAKLAINFPDETWDVEDLSSTLQALLDALSEATELEEGWRALVLLLVIFLGPTTEIREEARELLDEFDGTTERTVLLKEIDRRLRVLQALELPF